MGTLKTAKTTFSRYFTIERSLSSYDEDECFVCQFLTMRHKKIRWFLMIYLFLTIFYNPSVFFMPHDICP